MPDLVAGDVLVQVRAAAVNPSDVKNVLGKMHETTVPRIPGRDFAGVVVGGSAELSGRDVFGSGGNLGFGRDGSHAEFLLVPAAAVAAIPPGLSFVEAAASALSYFTASAAWALTGSSYAGRTVVVTGAIGGVGNAASCLPSGWRFRNCSAPSICCSPCPPRRITCMPERRWAPT